MLMLFECFYVGFGQFIAAFSPNELFASLLVPSFFTFVVSFCGVVVPYAQLPHFWQSWMYWLTPFTYLVEGLLSVLVHNVPIVCLDREEAYFSAPAGETCQSYAGAFAQQAGGTIRNAANGLCGYCQYATGDQFVSFSRYDSNLPVEMNSLLIMTSFFLHRLKASTSPILTSGEIM